MEGAGMLLSREGKRWRGGEEGKREQEREKREEEGEKISKKMILDEWSLIWYNKLLMKNADKG